MDANDIPAAPAEREQLARLWTREAALTGAALYLRTEDCDSVRLLSAWLTATEAPMAVEVRPGTAAERLDGLRLHLHALTATDRRKAWARDLGPLAQQMDGYLDRMVEYFGFDEPAIRQSAAAVRDAADTGADPGLVGWRVCREHARGSLDALAQRVEARACWADLILPASQLESLRQIAIHLRQRAVVNDQWGFAAKYARGLGLTALFAGSSGTGKTMAAEVLAAELDLDLYRIDLARWSASTSARPRRTCGAIFDAAEQSGAILLFDEADALFGKRSEVSDSHDRYANLEISYLLQRMEAYRGLAILTTNMQHALDLAFLRRIRFIVQFPFPDAPAARGHLAAASSPPPRPSRASTSTQLAQLERRRRHDPQHRHARRVPRRRRRPGRSRRHLLAAARTEYAKLDKPLSAAETRGLT